MAKKKKFKTLEITPDGQLKIIPGSSLDAVVAELQSLGSNVTKAQLRAANEQWVTNDKLSKGVFTSQAEIKLNIENLPYEALGLQYRGGASTGGGATGGGTGGSTGGGTNVGTGERTETRRVAMGVTNGIQQWQIFYSDNTFEYKYLNLNNNTWMDSNPYDGVPDQPSGPISFEPEIPEVPIVPTGPTIPAGPQIMAFDVFRDIITSLLGITDAGMLQDIYKASEKYLAEGISTSLIPDLLAGSPDAPASFKAFLGDFNNIKQLGVGVTTIAEFTRARNEYKSLMRYYGLSEYSSDASADKFLMNKVSVNEAAARMDAAYNAIKYADEALKTQLKTYFPSLTDKDIVANILGVGQTVAELQKKIGVSGIRAEAATAGLTGRLSAEELFAQGVSRQEARRGYQEVKAQKPLAEAAASRAQEAPSTVQTELEKESLLGLRSRRRAQLAAREQAYFAGKSGTGNISLGGSTSGAF